MKTIQENAQTFETIIKESLALVSESNLLSEDNLNTGKQEAQELLGVLSESFTVKVPFVGDFSAGKSSLLNALIGKDILPTSIRPETAVSYELYYAPNEIAELYRKGNEIKNCKLDEIKDLDVQPGDIVKVFIDNPKIKDLFDKGITLVDMPGSDSGIEAHQKAILSYLQEGSAFITLVDIEQGSIKGSNLKFMQEILGYNLDSAVLITKSDKKPTTEQDKIKEYILEQVQRYDKSNSSVGLVSAAEGEVSELENVLSGLNASKLFTERYQPLVETYLNQWLEWLQLEKTIVSKDKEELTKQLNELKESAEKAKQEIAEQQKAPDLGMFAVNEILHKVEDALKGRAKTIANYLVNNDQNSANREISDTVRPVLINSLQNVQSKLIDQVNTDFSEISEQLANFIGTEEKTMNALHLIKDQVEGLGDKVEGTNLSKYRAVTTILAVTTSFVAPWIEVLIIFGPEILKLFSRGKDNTDKLNQARNSFISTSIPEILGKLRPEVEKGIEEQRQGILANLKESVELKVQEVDKRIAEQEKEIALSEQEKDTKLATIENVLTKVKELRVQNKAILN